MLLYRQNQNKKSLSIVSSRRSQISLLLNSCDTTYTKALQYARRKGSLTVEAAFLMPVLVLCITAFLGLFFLIAAQIQTSAALQYTARKIAASCLEQEELQPLKGYVMERQLFQNYMQEHEKSADFQTSYMTGLSFLESDFSGDEITAKISYQVVLPVTFGKWGKLPVRQQVVCKKWTGRTGQKEADEDGTFVYITPSGRAYHRTTNCRSLDLSIRSVRQAELATVRNRDGSIYYACKCVKGHPTQVYITDYGTEYHADLGCSGLKRTVLRVRKTEIGERHPCRNCYGENQKEE